MEIIKKLGEFIVGSEKLLLWNRKNGENEDKSLIYRIPNDLIPDMKKVERFAVKDYERALVYQSGQFTSLLTGGIYELEKKHRNSATEIIFVEFGLIEFTWGIPYFQNALSTLESLPVGANGTIKLKISDPGAFIQKIVTSNVIYSVNSLKKFISSLLITSLRDIFKIYSLKNLIQANRDDLRAMIQVKISKEFRLYGLELIAIDILGFAFAPEHQHFINEIIDNS